MGWDPESDNFCLHDDDELGIALVTEGPTHYVRPVCENCGTLLGTKSCLWLLVSRAAAERGLERELEDDDLVSDVLLILSEDAAEDEEEEDEEDPE